MTSRAPENSENCQLLPQTAQPSSPQDLVRIPANSKSRFDLETQDAGSKQRKYCNSFLFAIGVNKDLITRCNNKKAAATESYRCPTSQQPSIPLPPEDLASDLYSCTTTNNCIYTVEDKDPSILWQMNSTTIFNCWFSLMAGSPDRCSIVQLSSEEILNTTAACLTPSSRRA